MSEVHDLPNDPNVGLLAFEACFCVVLVVFGVLCLAFDQWRARR